MAKVCPEMKEALVADGRWRDFVRCRDARKAEGVGRLDAHNMAIAEVCPDWADRAVGGKRGQKPAGGRVARKTGRSAETDVADAVERVANAAKRVDELEARKEQAAAKRRAEQNEGFLNEGRFAGGKPVSEAEEILWVLNNLGPDVDVEDAPGSLGWNLRQMCLKSADFCQKFTLGVVADVVKKRSEADAAKRARFDGEAEYDILANLGEAAG